MNTVKDNSSSARRWRSLVLYDLIPLIAIYAVMYFTLTARGTDSSVSRWGVEFLLGAVTVYAFRMLFGVYRQIWRFSNPLAYIKLIEADVFACLVYMLIGRLASFVGLHFTVRLCIICFNLIASTSMRMVYQFIYQYPSSNSKILQALRKLILRITGLNIDPKAIHGQKHRIKIAIVGAGRVGMMLADELLTNPKAPYIPVCFIDIDKSKAGRQFAQIPVIEESEFDAHSVITYSVQEFVFALPKMDGDEKQALYERYKKLGLKIKTYDYPTTQVVDGGKRHMREFNIEDLLFREEKVFMNEKTSAYYGGKTVLISGGGGSIGGELCRQIAKMSPQKLIILDIYENGAYDVQQELRLIYGKSLDLSVEIASVCDRRQLENIFEQYRPDVVIHAAAHKHVPLMEHNCCEAVRNNVFGTLSIVEVSEKYEVGKFIMVSTDKAVNPTNVMGATKRMCEMIVLSRNSKTNFSATRFGNVLGSNGSVIPLFKRQIANGGPVTLTDKRIIRYFMTIPEASQLVLQSGAMAKNGELYVLDMGKPIRILDLAENMIRLSGFEPYTDIDIIETGLRAGEKLYEELLVNTEELDKTENELIFVERELPPKASDIETKLDLLRHALESECDETVKATLHKAVPTYRTPEEVNATAVRSKEMQNA